MPEAIWIAVTHPICPECGTVALWDNRGGELTADFRLEAPVICPVCEWTGSSPRAFPMPDPDKSSLIH